MNPLLVIGLVIAAGLIGGAVAVRLRLPRITGYLVAGMVLSPSVLPLLTREDLREVDVLIFLTLAIIGFAIGKSIPLESLRALGRSVVWITLSQGISAWVLSTVLIAALGSFLLPVPGASWTTVYLPAALVIGAIAWPTAPAVTIALIRECRAAGPLTTASLVVVALSDAAAVIAFAFALDLALVLMGGGTFSIQAVLVPASRIVGAVALGGAFGLALSVLPAGVGYVKPVGLAAVLGVILGCAGLAQMLDLSAILATMVAGFVAANRFRSTRLVESVGPVEPLVFIVFFVLSGAYFDLGAFETAALLAVVITLGRSLGKYVGAYVGAAMSGTSEVMKRYVGLALLPKAGLTIGLAFLAEEALGPPLGTIVFNGLLASTLINMFFAPPLAKYAIYKSGEQGKAVEAARH